MYISYEIPQRTEERLKKVIKEASLKIYEGSYFFKETPASEFIPDPNALAFVKDDEVWSSLIPSVNGKNENFKIFRFHFKPNFDNSGFVGWLASKLKSELGTGVFVICGQNSNKGGIFDYWGCPVETSKEVISLLHKLRK